MTPERILVIEDSKFYSSTIQKRIRNVLHCDVVAASSYAETLSILKNDTDFFVALVDLHLPDTDETEVLDLVLSCDVAPVVLTGDFDHDLREKLVANNRLVDYIFKQQTQGFKYVTDLIKRLLRNKDIKLLIAEDSKSQRFRLKKMLEAQKFQVLEAGDGDTAFRLVEKNPDVRMVLTDYNMPVIDGFELLTMLRRKFNKEKLSVIGLSSEGNSFLSSRFLKMGANDFLTKPFGPEELIARVNQNLEIMEMLDALKSMAIKDPLTKLYNRRYFFEEGEALFNKCKESETPLCIAMIDIDYFKKVNDEYGHDAGDEVLKVISSLLVNNTRGSDIVARLGGEEFCIMASETDEAGAKILFEKIRSRIEDSKVTYNDQTINATVSMGIATGYHISLTDMLRQADQMLYVAKSEGRNRVIFQAP